MREAIGGYFGLELKHGKEFHDGAIKLNTARNALEYILKAKEVTKIYLPYYTCDVLLQPVKKLNIEFDFYRINNKLEADFNFAQILATEAFLYTNYFGLKDQYIFELKNRCRNLVIDNAQAFFSTPIEGIDTFYSCRKFFGVPDGAYLYTNKYLQEEIEQDVSYKRFEHLLRRIDVSAEDGYSSFSANDNTLDNQPIMGMSKLTQSILSSIDYREVAFQRRRNFEYLENNLREINKMHFKLDDREVPMVYPFLSEKVGLRQELINRKVYTAQYWPKVLDFENDQSLEYKYVTEIVHLPIDQRYCSKELGKIVELIKWYV